MERSDLLQIDAQSKSRPWPKSVRFLLAFLWSHQNLSTCPVCTCHRRDWAAEEYGTSVAGRTRHCHLALHFDPKTCLLNLEPSIYFNDQVICRVFSKCQFHIANFLLFSSVICKGLSDVFCSSYLHLFADNCKE